jgi:hypothetical protein
METCSLEEVHVLCLFNEPAAALEFGTFLADLLPRVRYDPARMGEQVVVDADDNVLDQPRTYFGAALEIGYDELCEEAALWGALVIPAHIDRLHSGVINHLGFLPEGPYAAVEAVRPLPPGAARGYTVVSGSDAHHPENIAQRPFLLDLPENWNARGIINLDTIRNALAENRVSLPFVR